MLIEWRAVLAIVQFIEPTLVVTTRYFSEQHGVWRSLLQVHLFFWERNGIGCHIVCLRLKHLSRNIKKHLYSTPTLELQNELRMCDGSDVTETLRSVWIVIGLIQSKTTPWSAAGAVKIDIALHVLEWYHRFDGTKSWPEIVQSSPIMGTFTAHALIRIVNLNPTGPIRKDVEERTIASKLYCWSTTR